MNGRQICKSSDHLFIPILEVSIPLLRCVRCNVYAYQETVKQLARNRSYQPDYEEPQALPPPPSYWRRLWRKWRHFISW